MVELTGSLIWVREDGVTLDLNDGVNIKLRHHDGFGIPEFQHAVVGSPGMAGDYWFGVRYPARIVTLDLTLYASGLAALQNLRATVISAVNPTLYSGTLKMIQANGVERWFDCVLAESLPMPTTQHIAQKAMMLTLRFRSVKDPFLYDPIAQEYVVPPGASSGNFMVGGFSFPFILSQSGVYNTVVLTYPGHVPTPVEITFMGPGIDPVLRNETLGRTIGFLGSGMTLATGAVLYINTDPRAKDILVGGLNGWPYLRESGFWWLQPGPNTLSFELGGSSGATTLSMRYYDRYLGL